MRLLLLPLLLLLAAATPPPAAQRVPSYGALDRTARLDATEKRLAAIVRESWPAAEIGVDRALSLAARELAAAVAAGASLESAARSERLRLAVARAGAVAPEVQPHLVRASSMELALQRLRERLGQEGTQPPPEQVGVGAAARDGRYAVVVLRAPDRAAVQPFPAQVAVGSSHRLAGTLRPPLGSPSLYLTSPGGAPAKLRRAGEGGRFASVVHFPRAGHYILEVIGDGPAGPQVAVLLDVWAGGPIPDGAGEEAPQAEPMSVDGKELLAAELANELRRSRGLRPLRIDPMLQRTARAYAEELLRTGRFAHRSPISGDLQDRLRAAGYPYLRAGENLAQAPTVREAHASTVRSPGHLANLVEPGWTEAGFGLARGKTAGGQPTVVLVQLFAAPRR
ncbi:CAP domain-containing protein [Vulgatibacter sp.]|uniref:CAP domain-containing protein n=1 Tax=Vulgatibacter sp. TaxID=1971226 RepID=UPI0035613C87